MSDKHLRRAPHKARGADDWWWYEESTGITVLVEQRDVDGRYRKTTHHQIPWHLVRTALARKDKK